MVRIRYFSGGYMREGDVSCYRFADRVIVVETQEDLEKCTKRKLGAVYLARSSGWTSDGSQYPGCQAH